MIADGSTFISIWTNGASKDICLASDVRNYLRVRMDGGRLIVSSRDARVTSACHMWGFAPKLQVFHIEVFGPFIFGEDAVCHPENSPSPSELLNTLFVNQKGEPLKIPWASHQFNGFLPDSETIVSVTANLKPEMIISELMEEVCVRWNKVAEKRFKWNPDSTICVVGIGSRGFYIPPTVHGAQRSKTNKR